MSDTINETISQAGEQVSQTAQALRDAGRQALNSRAVEATRDYVERGRNALSDASDSLSGFVRREPWLALAAAFVVGYVAAQVVRRMP